MAVNINMNDRSINLDRKNGNPKKKSKKRLFITISLVLLLLSAILGGVFYLGQKAGIKLSITDIFSPIKINPQLKKDSSEEYTNILFVGIDSRIEDSGLKNTDTIMLVSYNHKNNYAVMTSIPRDFFVEVPEQARYTKINGIYAIGERIEPGYGMSYLQGVVEKITGREIQYYGMVNLAGFVDLIDAVGGIEVDVENSFTDHRYPVEGAETRHQTISFQKGLQKMDGITALRFVRSRMSMDAYEGSDFARARRQQRVIDSLKNELLSSSTYLNPQKIMNILNVVGNNIETSEFTNEEIQAALRIFRKGEIQTFSFVLDPSIANFKLITDKGITLNAYTIGPTAGLNNYEEIRKYLEHAHKKPTLYSEDPTITIYDVGIGYNEALEKVQKLQEKHPYIKIQYLGTLFTDIKGNYFYPTSEEANKDIEKYFPLNITEKPEFMGNGIPNGDYIILLGNND